MPEKSEKRLTLKKIEDSDDLSREDKTAMQMIIVANEALKMITDNILKLAKHYYDNDVNAQKRIEELINKLEAEDGGLNND